VKALNIVLLEPNGQLATHAADLLQQSYTHINHFSHLPQSIPSPQADLVICADLDLSPDDLKRSFPQASFWLALTPTELTDHLSQLGNFWSSYVLHPYHPADLRPKVDQFYTSQTVALQNRISQTFAHLRKSLVDKPDKPHMKGDVSRILVENYGYTAVCFHMLQHNLGVLDIFIQHGVQTAAVGNFTAVNKKYRQHLYETFLSQPFQGGIETYKPTLLKNLTAIPAVQAQPAYAQLIAAEGWESALLLPIYIKHDLHGIMVCYKNRPDDFDSFLGLNERETLQEMAHLVAIDHSNWREFRKWHITQVITERLAEVHSSRDQALDLFANDIMNVSEAQGTTICYFAAEQHRFLPQFQRTIGPLAQNLLDWYQLDPAWQTLFDFLLADSERYRIAIPSLKSPHIRRADLQNATGQDKTEVLNAIHQLRDALLANGVKSLIIRELNGMEDPVGMVVLLYNYEHAYADLDVSREFRRPVTLYLNQFAIVLSRCRQAEHTTREFDALLQFASTTHVVSPAADISENLWRQTLRTLMQITGADRACVGFVREDWGVTQYSDSDHSFPPNFIEQELENRDECVSPVCQAVKQTDPLRVRDFADTPFAPVHTGSAMLMAIHKENYNIIFVLWSDQIRTFDKYDEDSIIKFANFVSMDSSKIDASGRFSPRAKLDFVREAMDFTAVQPVRYAILEELEAIHDQFGYDLIHFHAFTPENEQIGRPLVYGRLDADIVLHRGLIRDTYQVRQNDPTDNDYFSFAPHWDTTPYFEPELLERFRIEDTACVSFYHSDRPLGWLFIHRQKEHDFTADAAHLRLHLRRIALRLVKADILPSLLTRLCSNLQIDAASLHIFNHEQNQWDLPVRYLNGRVLPIIESRSEYNTEFVEQVQHLERFDYFTPDAGQSSIFSQSSFVQRENMRAVGYVHLISEGQFLGVLFVNRHNNLWWTETEEEIIRIFAQIAEVVVRNRYRLDLIKDHRNKFDHLRQAAANVIVAGQNIPEVSHIILRAAVQLTQASFGTLRLLEGDVLVAQNVWGLEKETRPKWDREYKQLSLDKEESLATGYYSLTAQTYHDYLAGQCPDDYAIYSAADPEGYSQRLNNAEEYIQSTIVIIIPDAHQATPLGTITLEHTDTNAFKRESVETLKLLANLASFALSNALRLSDAQTTETLAWSGLFGSNWWHDVSQKSRAIDFDLALLRRLKVDNPKFYEAINRIEGAVKAIEEVPAQDLLPRAFEEKPQELDIHRVLTHQVNMLLRPHPHCQQIMEFTPETRPFVKIHDSQFRMLLERLIKNSLDAMNYRGRLVVRTKIVMGDLEVQIEDNGPGIPPHVQRMYLKKKTPSKKGAGIGGLIAKFICQRSGGQLRVTRTGKQGTCMSIFLPLAGKPEPQEATAV